ncbi:hypothetical protein CCUS01_09050 [Colletotrichum cuscutae]|uniref:Uncharacterized protein n=1 Tax=Colletotrichum cuscutae TaxID=1209917 RepID=A0AAI9XPN1_9PEZI|nr:hypothetical protein CCUS01_09050 [Colletotrichum cuscutae]
MPISSIIPLVFLFITPCPSWLSSPTSVVLLLLTSSQIRFPQSISHPFILPLPPLHLELSRPRPFTVLRCRRKNNTQQSIPIPTLTTPCRDYKTISYNHNKQHRQHPSNRSQSTIPVDPSRQLTIFFDDQHSSSSSAQSLTQRRYYASADIDRSQLFGDNIIQPSPLLPQPSRTSSFPIFGQ